jgi:hypothetical protein
MRIRRRRLLLLGLPAALMVALLAAWLLWPRTAITRANAARVENGMTLVEVEAILGGPARDESSGELQPDGGWQEVRRLMVMEMIRSDDPQYRLWKSNTLLIGVHLAADGRVYSTESVPVQRVHESPFDRLRRWIGL